MNIKEKLVELMQEEKYKPLDFKELCNALGIEKDMKKEFLKILNTLEDEGRVVFTNAERFGTPEKLGIAIGTIQGNQKGFGFLIQENEKAKDIFISPENIGSALHGDKVTVKVLEENPQDKSPQGKVINILERANKIIIGTFQKNRNFAFVVPDDKKISCDVFISKNGFNGAKDGQKVVAKVTTWPIGRKSAEGEIVEIIGNSEDVATHIEAVLLRHKIRREFPAPVIDQAKNIDMEISEEEISRRKDLRHLPIITIDGEDTKDIDDAVHVEKLDGNRFKLSVHIADVTHYVKENSKIDKEAFKRATSVYIATKTIPMLPKELSNGVCSLNPNEDKLTLSCEMIIDGKGKLLEHSIFESIICSKYKMNYTDVSNMLENNDQNLIKKYEDIWDMIRDMQELCLILRKKRDQKGSIDFDFAETKLIVNKKNIVTDVTKYERRISNKIIEEFMLMANETIAENYYWLNMPFVYRIHEEPEGEKMEQFSKFVLNLGYVLKGSQEIHPRELQQLLIKIRGKKEETLINTLMLRALRKAVYSNECYPHFGLATNYYCHFTSPIRRYPDLQIHRIIKAQINGKISEGDYAYLEEKCVLVSEKSSKQERIADEVERDTDKILIAQYMSDKLGEEYAGIISGVTNFGVFVELGNTVEGLVHITDLVDDYYVFDNDKKVLRGRINNREYKIGDKMKVGVAAVNIPNGEVNFFPVS